MNSPQLSISAGAESLAFTEVCGSAEKSLGVRAAPFDEIYHCPMAVPAINRLAPRSQLIGAAIPEASVKFRALLSCTDLAPATHASGRMFWKSPDCEPQIVCG